MDEWFPEAGRSSWTTNGSSTRESAPVTAGVIPGSSCRQLGDDWHDAGANRDTNFKDHPGPKKEPQSNIKETAHNYLVALATSGNKFLWGKKESSLFFLKLSDKCTYRITYLGQFIHCDNCNVPVFMHAFLTVQEQRADFFSYRRELSANTRSSIAANFILLPKTIHPRSRDPCLIYSVCSW